MISLFQLQLAILHIHVGFYSNRAGSSRIRGRQLVTRVRSTDLWTSQLFLLFDLQPQLLCAGQHGDLDGIWQLLLHSCNDAHRMTASNERLPNINGCINNLTVRCICVTDASDARVPGDWADGCSLTTRLGADRFSTRFCKQH